MEYDNVSTVIQIFGTDTNSVTRKLNAYISPKHGWKIIAILQLTDGSESGFSCPVFILGHSNTSPTHPTTTDEFGRVWS